MGMVERYLDSLAAHLPEQMRLDVKEELEVSIREQIEDRESQLGRGLNNNEIEEILRGLGHPMRVASAYLPEQHLIGPDAFPAYKRALKVTLTWVLGISLLLSLPFFISDGGFLPGLFSITGGLIQKAVWVFAVVTALFFLLERNPGSLNGLYKWSPLRLREAQPGLKINRLETGFELLIEVVFLAWWNGLWHFPATIGDQVQISMSSQWSTVFWAVNVLCGLSVLVGLYKFAMVGWNRKSLIGGILICLAELGVLARILSFDSLTVLTGGTPNAAELETYIPMAELFARSVVWLVAIIIVLEMVASIRKLLQLRKSEQ